jgi:hypothetical protein
LVKKNIQIGEEKMIKPEELTDKNFKIFLGMPMYGGMLSEATLHGLLELQQWSMSKDKNVQMRIQTMGNESLITRARNTIVSMMMALTNQIIVTTFLLLVLIKLLTKKDIYLRIIILVGYGRSVVVKFGQT